MRWIEKVVSKPVYYFDSYTIKHKLIFRRSITKRIYNISTLFFHNADLNGIQLVQF